VLASSGVFQIQTRVRFVDTDASGRIHYTAMFRYFEAAETEFMRAAGITYRSRSYDFPRVHVECDFRLPVGHDDVLTIEVALVKLGRSSVHLEFRSLRNGQLTATGVVVTACADRTTHRPVPIPGELRVLLEPLVAKHGEVSAG
jgi:acyl-CoA thioester hydrolase